jgi:hypothetical protein
MSPGKYRSVTGRHRSESVAARSSLPARSSSQANVHRHLGKPTAGAGGNAEDCICVGHLDAPTAFGSALLNPACDFALASTLRTSCSQCVLIIAGHALRHAQDTRGGTVSPGRLIDAPNIRKCHPPVPQLPQSARTPDLFRLSCVARSLLLKLHRNLKPL